MPRFYFDCKMAAAVCAALLAFGCNVSAIEPDEAAATNSATPATGRYGLFDWLDHRSQYTSETFIEPFLLEDMAYEENEIELSWLHAKGVNHQDDEGGVEFQKGIGLLTLQVEAPYENVAGPHGAVQGFGSIEISARCPFFQSVSQDKMIDNTVGLAMEGDLPVRRDLDPNPELEPTVFDDLALGSRFTAQAILGCSTLLGSGDEGGLLEFDYGFSLACAIPRSELALPGVDQLLPMLELIGETDLNKDEAGQNFLEGDAGFRVKFKTDGEFQPGLGVAYVVPLDGGARKEFHWGFIVSSTFEF